MEMEKNGESLGTAKEKLNNHRIHDTSDFLDKHPSLTMNRSKMSFYPVHPEY